MQDKSLKQKVQEEHLFEYSITPIFPKNNFLIELSNICNDKCIFCANKKMNRKKGYMNFDFLTSILNQAYENGCREVGFYSTGEPLVYPKLPEAIKTAKDIGFDYTYITTNGALLTEDKMIKITNAGIDSIKFSINAFDNNSYKLIHGKDDFELVITNLERLFNYRKDNNLKFKIYISFVVTKFTQDKIEYFKNKYSHICDEISFCEVGNQAGMNSEIYPLLTCDETENKKLYEDKKIIPCYRVFNGLTVTYEGYLSACCVDFENQLIIADLNKMSLKDAWLCEKFKNFRRMHLDKKVKGTLCQNCCNYSKKSFEPLNSEYATKIDFNSIYSDEDIKKRIEQYNKDCNQAACNL